MKLSNNNISLALFLALFTSCEKEINVKTQGHSSLLVVNSITNIGDTIQFWVGKSVSVHDYNINKDLTIGHARIVMTTGSKSDTLKYDSATKNYISHTLAEVGKQYAVSIIATGFPDATSVTSAPEYTPIKSIERVNNARLDAEGKEQDEIKISFDDPVSIGDYYIIRFTKIVNFTDSTATFDCINSPDPSIESINNESIDQNTCLQGDAIFIRDELFNGSTKELRLFVQSEYLRPKTKIGNLNIVSLELYHVTEAYFRFQKSRQFALENTGNPFAEPTNLTTNILKGYGVFSIISFDTKFIN